MRNAPAAAAESPRAQLLSGVLLWLSLAVCAWVYWPGLDGPALLDDGANLRVVYSLDESPEYLSDIVFGNRAGPLGRPLSMLSFGIERIWAGAGLREMKYHNLMLHLLNGCLAVWLALRVLPRLGGRPVEAGWAVLVGALWLLTPFFVSTTLYIVQRMALLSALFCFLGLLSYVAGRERLEAGARSGWLGIAALLPCAGAAVLAKENGGVLLPLVIVTEWAAWRWTVAGSARSTRALRLLHAGVVGLGLLAVCAFIVVGERDLLGGYAKRDFTLTDRLLSEARILWDYAGGLLLPLREGRGLFHDDYVVSRGLLQPLSTLPAVAALLLATVAACVRLLRGRCIASWALLFFLAGHLIESTLLPLELYFEHRNYLPAFGLYAGCALAARALIRRLDWSAPLVHALIAGWLLVAAVQTGLQSLAWSREVVLLLDTARSHPASQRVQANLATNFARMGAVSAALRHAAAAEALDEPGHLRHSLRRLALLCTANAPLGQELVDEVEFRLSPRALADAGVSESLQFFVEKLNRGQCPALDARPLALMFRARLLGEGRLAAAPRIYGLLAILENYLDRNAVADRYLDHWLRREPDAVQGWMIRLTITPPGRGDGRRAEALAQLQRLDAQGRVTREQRDDIELLAPGWQSAQAGESRNKP